MKTKTIIIERSDYRKEAGVLSKKKRNSNRSKKQQMPYVSYNKNKRKKTAGKVSEDIEKINKQSTDINKETEQTDKQKQLDMEKNIKDKHSKDTKQTQTTAATKTTSKSSEQEREAQTKNKQNKEKNKEQKNVRKTIFDIDKEVPVVPLKVTTRKSKIFRYLKLTLAIVLVGIGGYGINVFVSFQRAIKDVGAGDTPSAVEIQNLNTEPFNILFIGLGTNGKDGEQPLADSINIFSVNPKENYAEAIAIPRDAYLPFGSSCEWGIGYFDKITHATGVSAECLQTTLTDVFGIDINYYVSVDFNGFVEIVDALGGIEMKVPDLVKAFNEYEDPKLKPELKTGTQWCEHDSKRRRYRVCFDKFGKQTVTGEQALALARSRHYDGDAARNLRQTEMIKAILAKATSPSSLFSVSEILRTGGQAVTTNIPSNQFLGFFSLAQKMLGKSAGSAFEMRTTQLGGYDELLIGDRLGEELYFRVVPVTSIYNVSEKMWHATHDGKVVVSPETFDFSIEDDPEYDDINFFYDPKLHDESIYDYSQRWL